MTTTIVPHQPSPVVGSQLPNASSGSVRLPQHHHRVLERDEYQRHKRNVRHISGGSSSMSRFNYVEPGLLNVNVNNTNPIGLRQSLCSPSVYTVYSLPSSTAANAFAHLVQPMSRFQLALDALLRLLDASAVEDEKNVDGKVAEAYILHLTYGNNIY
ncbi:hypothetical protein JOM56_001727 [Amanita muscaria]